MQKTVLLILFSLALQSLLAQNKDTANISITNYKLSPGTFSWRGNNQFYDMTSWDSSPYLEGHLKQGTQFRMNFRLLLPLGHNVEYKPGYPLIVMFHGAGERGNCWVDNCYCPDPTGCNPNNTPIENTDPRFLNNDHNLVHGGLPHLSARNRAGTKLPDDATLATNAFPGFVLFPQNNNQWRNSGSPASSDVSNAIRIIRLLTRQYNIDQDRIYIHGLSMGAQALLEALNYSDWLFAAAAPMSPINFSQTLEYDSVRNIPFWIFQGGQDLNPKPAETEGMIESLREKGANVRYSLYPSLGHGTWNTAYSEPDFFNWLLSKNKSNIHVDYGKPNVCATTGEGATLVLPQGFLAYQWERDGAIIAGATSNVYVATLPGAYRARYSRLTQNPSGSEWNRWSDPVIVGEKAPEAPVIEQLGTNVLSDLNLGSIAYLKVPPGFEKYLWFQNGAAPQKELVQSPADPSIFTHAGCTGGGACIHSGEYTLITEGYDKCPSLPSDPVTILYGTHNTVTVPPAITGTPNNFTAELKSPTSALLWWNDQSTNERGFEIWRRKLLNVAGEDFSKGWVMATITREDVTMYLDTGLHPSSTYYYKIRAVSNAGRSNYFPGNTQGNINHNRVVTTSSEETLPTPPTNVLATTAGPGIIRVTWEESTDNSGIRQYYVYFNNDSIATGTPVSSYLISDLDLNEVYNVTVKAQDLSDNLSLASNPSNANTFVSGLFYKHSTGSWSAMSQMTDTWTNPEFTGWVSSISLQERTQDDYFNFEFQGFVYINTPGTYQFRTTSDDGSQLFLNNIMIVNNDGLHGNVTVTSADQIMDTGAMPITVRYFESTGGQTLTVQYRGPDTGNNWLNIPATALKSGNAPAPPVPPAVPTNLTATPTETQQIDLGWSYAQSKIVILGSSTAFGTGASPIETHSWASRLAAWLDANDTEANIVNLAFGGFDTYDVLPTGDPERNITKALSLSPDIIIVNLPSNDAANGIAMETTLQNLTTLRDLAIAQNVKIFFTTTQPRNFATLIQREILKQTAEEIKTTFGNYVIDIYDELTNPADLTIKPVYNADGTHVNNAGHEYIFNTIRKKLSLYLITFEVQRGMTETGPFKTIGRTFARQYEDPGLTPGMLYFYRLRATQIDTVSQFTPVVLATTLSDTESPSQPGKPILHRSGYATISITWPESTDNAGVAGYEIYANGILMGISKVNGFQAKDLQPETSYTFTIIAYDQAGNKSSSSVSLSQVTSSGTFFYSQNGSTQLNNLSSWKTQTGISPTSFSDNGQVFVIRHSLPVGSPWKVEGTISKVVIDNGVIITLDSNPIDGIVDINGTGVLNLTTSMLPKLGTLSASSKVRYTSTTVQKANYGHLELLTNNATYTFAEGITQIQGNLITASGVTLQGASSNTTTLQLKGNLTIPGLPQQLANSFAAALHLSASGNQTLNLDANPGLFEIRKSGAGTVTINNTSSPFVLTLGSPHGGGLALADGSFLQAGDNSISIKGAGSINANGESGALGITGGDIEIESVSSAPLHLYLHNTNNIVKRFSLNKPGECFIHSAMKISDAIKIHRGHIHSDGNITLSSTATKTANVEEIENDGQISGDVRVERYVSEVAGNVRFMSASVDGMTIADWQTAFPVTGNFSGSSAGSTESSLFTYAHPYWIGYPLSTNAPPFNTSAAPIEKGKGYVSHIQNAGPVVMKNTGELWQGNIDFALTPPIPGAINTGWNLAGNPYASTIEWNHSSWISSNVSSIASVSKASPMATQYEYFDARTMTGTATSGDFATGVILPGQAFWVQASGENPSLTITEKAKTAQGEAVETGSVGYIRLILANGPEKDAAVVAITPYGNDFYEAQYDGYKRQNEGMFNFSSLTSDGVAVAINNSGDEFCAKQVTLSIQDAAVGTYGLRPESLSTLSGIESVKLVDHFTNTTVDFKQTPEYAFMVTADPRSFGNSRFELVLSRSEIDLTIASHVKVLCNQSVEITLTDTQSGASYGLYNSAGQELAFNPVSPGGDISFVLDPEDLTNGNNTVIVKASLPGCSSAQLPQSVEFEYYHTPVITASDITVCSGEEGTIEVSGGASVARYEWYLDGMKIEGNETSTLITAPVDEELYYSVSAIQPNGCKGPEKHILVSPIYVADPQISQDDELISVDVAGEQYEWFRNGISVGVTSKPFFEFSGSGAYTVTVMVGQCHRTSPEFVVTGVLAEYSSRITIFAYPNPTRQDIRLRITSRVNEKVLVRLVDLTGRTLIYRELSPSEFGQPILLNDGKTLPSGVYFIRAEQRSKTLVIKTVVE